MSMNIEANKKKLIGWIISILVPAIIAFVPVSPNFTQNLKLFFIITLFVILIIAFELLPQLISAFLLPTLYLVSGLVPIEIAFKSWTSTTVWMVLGGLIFSNVLDDCGLLKRIAYYVISKCGGTYAGTVFGCFFIGIALNIVTFCYGWLVSSALVFGICKAMDLKPSRESSLVCFAGTIGATGATIFMYYPGYFALMETAIRKFIPNYRMNMFSSFMYNGFAVIFYILTLIILMKIYKTKDMDVKFGKELFEEKYKELGKMSVKEKKSVVMIVLLLVYLFTTGFTKLPAAYGFMLIPFLMYLPGIDIGDSKTLSKLNFSMVFFVATCLGIGIVGAEVGFGDFLSNIAVPMLSGKSPLIACIAFMFIGTVANFFMTPFAMLGSLSIPFAQIAVSLGMSPIAAVMILLLSCEILLLPYQSAGNLIMYSYGLMPMKDFIKQEGLKALIMIVGFILVMYPLWNLFGLM
ncbi:SLC13 family permease [Caloramator quimbayensis]|nr:SLC13 family permease [Caloramator quimbayensis]